MRPGTLFLIGAIVLAAATAYFFYDFLQQQAKPQAVPEKVVVMARVAIPARQPITADMLATVRFPIKLVFVTNTVAKIEDVVGKWTITPVKQFEQIRLSDITDKNKLPGLAPNIPAGKRAVTIGISDTKGVAGAILPGDHVDIIANLKDASRNEQVVQVPLQNMLVLAVDKGSTDSTVPATSSLTLCCTPDEAQLITIAEESGAIRVMLRARDDTAVIEDSSVSIGNYLKRRSLQDQPKVEPQPQPQPHTPLPAAPQGPPTKKLTIIEGSKEPKTYNVPTSPEKEPK